MIAKSSFDVYNVFMTYELPQAMKTAVEDKVLAMFSQKELVQAAESLSNRYRRLGNGGQFQLTSQVEACAYLISRMPATFAANMRIIKEIYHLLPNFEPETVLDIGAGPGTASLAAYLSYDTIEPMDLIEPNQYLREAGQTLVLTDMPETRWINETLASFTPDASYDLVLASYVLNELRVDDMAVHISKLWDACSGVMVIVEPGTPEGASIIQQVRDWAITQNVAILAPCPHAHDCPLKDTQSVWCHFTARTSRSKLHKVLKGGDVGFEDEKFSYIVLGREDAKRPDYRIIGHPAGTKLRELQVCGPKGAETLQVSKSHKLHKLSKKLEWGDGFDL